MVSKANVCTMNLQLFTIINTLKETTVCHQNTGDMIIYVKSRIFRKYGIHKLLDTLYILLPPRLCVSAKYLTESHMNSYQKWKISTNTDSERL